MKGKCLAIIPARSGSRGLKDKNIALLAGKPLIAYSIEAALESKCFSHVCVSTDSQKYADIAVSFGAEAPFLRTAATASDTASSWDVVKEVVKEYHERGFDFSQVCLLQPTSPLRASEDILKAFSLFEQTHAGFVESLVEMEHSPLWANTIDDTYSLKNFVRPENNVRRQDLPLYYRENGAIYIMETEMLNHLDEMYGDRSFGYIMKREHSIDIDSRLDLLLCEALLSYQGKK